MHNNFKCIVLLYVLYIPNTTHIHTRATVRRDQKTTNGGTGLLTVARVLL